MFLHRNRYDVDGSTTIFGCTLSSTVAPQQMIDMQTRLTDFHEQRGIRIGRWSRIWKSTAEMHAG